jgi:hypothetical protein
VVWRSDVANIRSGRFGVVFGKPERQQFDYWLGDWTITYPGAPGGSTSKVYLRLDKCVLVETWDGGRGHKGENVFAYSSDDGSWHGMFADNQGRVHVFKGKSDVRLGRVLRT